MIQNNLADGWPINEIRTRLDGLTKAQLEQRFSFYSKAFLKKEERWLLKQERRVVEATELALSFLRRKTANKQAILTLNAIPFLTSGCFERFVKYLPKDAQKIMNHVLLHGPIGYEDVERIYGIKGFIESSKPNWKGEHEKLPSPELRFLVSSERNPYHYYGEDNIFYSLSVEIRELISHLLFPDPIALTPYVSPEDSEEKKTISCEFLVQEELPELLIRLQQKPLKLTQKGRPSVASVRSIGKKLKLREFYPDTEQPTLKHIRAIALIGLLSLTKKLNTDDLAQLIKDLFTEEFTSKFHLPIHMLGYIKGVSKLDLYRLQNCGEIYKDLVRQLPQGHWIGYEELILVLKKRFFFASPITHSGLYDLGVEVDDPGSRFRSHREIKVYPHRIEKLIIWPSFHATMFIFASWGLIDMMYEEPDVSKWDKTANSPYDGIKAIRVNDLGAYVLGINETYESKVKAPFALELAQDSLSILLVDGDQERAARAIASIAKPLGKKRFYTDAGLFLGDCKSPADLNHKIHIFKTVFSGEIPANWQRFFDEISQKINPLEPEKNFSIFRVGEQNHNLLHLITRDPELKRLCLKAEGFLILIAKKDIKKFKMRLQTFGYLLE